MKAIVYEKYGSPDVLELKEVEKPIPKINELLIKTVVSTVTTGECELRTIDFPAFMWLPIRIAFGLFNPKMNILGQEIGGIIEEIGEEVSGFNVGDEIIASTGMPMGGHAEYICIASKNAIAKKPSDVSFKDGVGMVVGGLNALHFLRLAKVEKGESILINGAGGCIGTIGIQLAKNYGAEVTVVDSSDKLDMLRSIGADHVVDYKKQNVWKNGKTYDVIFDIVRYTPLSSMISSLNENGRILMANPSRLSDLLRGAWLSKTSDKKVISKLAGESSEDLKDLLKMLSSHRLKAVIDREMTLEEVKEAHIYVDKGLKTGNLIINMV